jgi:hypothetical protein
MAPSRARVRYVVFTWIPEDRLAEWDAWHNSVHIPHVLAAPQMRGVRKHRVAHAELPGGWTPQYATVYTLDSLEAFHAYVAGSGPGLRQEYEERYWGLGKIARAVLVEDNEAPSRGDP